MDAGKVQTFLTRLGCEKIRTRSATWVRSTCPLARWKHSGARDEHPSFAVSIKPGDESHCKCLACGAHGALIPLLWKLERYGRREPELFKFLVEHNKRDLDREPPISENDLAARLKRVASYDEIDPGTTARFIEEEKQATVPETTLDDYRAHMPEEVTQYLYDRGLTDETIDLFEIGWHAEQRRIVIPIRDESKTLVALSGRAIDDHVKPKYMHSRFKRDRVLFNEDKIVKGRPGYLVEGFFQAIWLQQLGYVNVVARMGTHLSQDQFEKLVTYFTEVIIVPDGDKAGRDSAATIEALVKLKRPARTVDMPDGLDADKLSAWQCQQMLGPPSGVTPDEPEKPGERQWPSSML